MYPAGKGSGLSTHAESTSLGNATLTCFGKNTLKNFFIFFLDSIGLDADQDPQGGVSIERGGNRENDQL